MATTIKSTELDFDTIKNNLKVFLAQTPEFTDYNFEASALSSILDVLAYNTHYNALTANFALNESFLSTAQLRSSLVSLGAALGYTVGSKTASCAVLRMYVSNPLVPSSMTLPAGFRFSTTVNNKSYTFKTRDNLVATNDGSNAYYFQLGTNQNVAIYEGTPQRKTFIAGPSVENESYVIPTENLDLDTVQVRVYEDVSTSLYVSYTNINDAQKIDKNSTIFVIKETPNGFYELTFGNGSRLGKFPSSGNKIEVLYDSVAGPSSNGARTFSPLDNVFDEQGTNLKLNITTIVSAMAGAEKEGLESIRKNAPYLYAAQNRMVTAQDYSSLVLRKFSNVLSEVKAWGGEDNVPAEYGKVFLSLLFSTTSDEVKESTKTQIVDLAKNLSVASFTINFTDPLTTFLELTTTIQWNPSLTSSSQTQIEGLVKATIESYFSEQLGGFDKSFRRSNLLTRIDDADGSILSSKTSVKMQSRFIPKSGVVNYEISFPVGIAVPDDKTYIIRSENFLLNNSICYLQNRLNTNDIEVVEISSGTVIVDNIGSYDETSGTISLSSFTGTLLSTVPSIKITAIPANQATLNATRNNILAFDNSASVVTAVITDTV